jgi:hypothetical protein
LYDYGFAFDGNFAQQLQNRLFETTNKEGKKWRNDLIAINICRGREHGLPSYNDVREYCRFPRAYYFEDFGDTINYDGIKKLQGIYKLVEIFFIEILNTYLYDLDLLMMSICLLDLLWKIKLKVVLSVLLLHV